jgi:hypothetical protein
MAVHSFLPTPTVTIKATIKIKIKRNTVKTPRLGGKEQNSMKV